MLHFIELYYDCCVFISKITKVIIYLMCYGCYCKTYKNYCANLTKEDKMSAVIES